MFERHTIVFLYTIISPVHMGALAMRPSPQCADRILLDRSVWRADDETMSDGLADEDAVEGVTMQIRQLNHLGHSFLGQW